MCSPNPRFPFLFDVKMVFNSFGRVDVRCCHSRNGVSHKFISLIQLLYAKPSSRYGNVALILRTRCDVQQDNFFSFPLHFCHCYMVVDIALSSGENSGITAYSDFNFADEFVPLTEGSGRVHTFPHHLNDCVACI